MGWRHLRRWTAGDDVEATISLDEAGRVLVSCGDPNTIRGGGVSCDLAAYVRDDPAGADVRATIARLLGDDVARAVDEAAHAAARGDASF